MSAIGQIDQQTIRVPSSVNPAFDFGAGLRIYFNERFAIRMEMKGFKPMSSPDLFEPRLFYRLR